MRHHKRDRRAHRASAESSFEQFEAALRGESADRRGAGRRDQKARQLCRQVERAVGLALAGECRDEILRELMVESVEPAGGTALLVVRLRVPANVTLAEAAERLDRHAGRLRGIVAGAICRKRAPMLTFLCAPATALEGGGHV